MSSIIWDLLGSVVTVVIPIIVGYIVVYLREKRNQIRNDIKQSEIQKFESSIIEAIDIVERVVQTVAQTYVDSLKARGEFTKEAQMESFNTALELAKTLIPEETKKLIEVLYTDLDTWLKVQIESYIKTSKK